MIIFILENATLVTVWRMNGWRGKGECRQNVQSSHVGSTYSVLSIAVKGFYIDRYGIFMTCRVAGYYPRITHEETEAQRSEETCPRSHSWNVAELGFHGIVSWARLSGDGEKETD